MEQKFLTINVITKGIGLYEITDNIIATVSEVGFKNALVNLTIPHTSCSLLIQENASPDVQKDLISFFNKIAPMNHELYQHDIEGVDDMPAHLKTLITNTNLTISVDLSKLILGVWQGIYLCEWRKCGQTRSIIVHLLGE